MKHLFSILLLTLPGSPGAFAQWQVDSQTSPVPLGHGATQVVKSLSGPTSADLNLVFFDSKRCTIQVADQPDKSAAKNLAQTSRELSAIAGCNGGYFTPEFKPLGLSISQAGRFGKFERSSLLGGLLQVRKGKPVLLWRDEFTEVSGITNLIQAGPRLVNGGLPVKGLEAERRRPRTFICTDTAGHWAIGTCRSVTLRELSDLLATPEIIKEFPIERALNLDGGSSTGLWWKDESNAEHYEREYSTVRNFLVVVPLQ